MDTPQQRYARDPQFHALVDTIYHAIRQCKYTATEVREAAMLAAIIYDQRHAVPTHLSREQADKWAEQARFTAAQLVEPLASVSHRTDRPPMFDIRPCETYDVE